MISQAPGVLARYERQLQHLVQQHQQLDDRLSLAVAYMPEGDEQNVYLLEVLDKSGWPGEGFVVDGQTDLFETEFASTAGFPLEPDQRLHLVLTSRMELPRALGAGWPLAEAFRGAVWAGRFVELAVAPEYRGWREQLRGGNGRA